MALRRSPDPTTSAVGHVHWCCPSSANASSSRPRTCTRFPRKPHAPATLSVAASGRRCHAHCARVGQTLRRPGIWSRRWCRKTGWHCSMLATIQCSASPAVSGRLHWVDPFGFRPWLFLIICDGLTLFILHLRFELNWLKSKTLKCNTCK